MGLVLREGLARRLQKRSAGLLQGPTKGFPVELPGMVRRASEEIRVPRPVGPEEATGDPVFVEQVSLSHMARGAALRGRAPRFVCGYANLGESVGTECLEVRHIEIGRLEYLSGWRG